MSENQKYNLSTSFNLIGVIFAASLSTLILGHGAYAQDVGSRSAENGPEAEVEEITVTARRREERLQDVPVVVNVMTTEEMEEQDVRTFTDFERSLPAVSTCCGRGSVSAFTFIRGVNSTAAYFAEVPTTLNGSSLFFDLQDAQVLKGPQGTLFGIATNGGAVLYEPNRPTNDLEGYVSTGVGDYGRTTVEGVINVPVTDNFNIRAGATREKRDGYVQDVTNNREMGNEDYWTFRLSSSWQITDSLHNYSMVNLHESDTTPAPLGIPYGPRAGIAPDGIFESVFGGPELEEWIQQQEDLGRYAIVGTSVEGGPRSKTERIDFVSTTTYDLSPSLSLRAIMGYSEDDNSGSRSDTDASPFPAFETSFPTNYSGPSRQYSAELQAQGEAFGGRLTYVLGSFNQWLRQDDPAIGYSFSLGTRSGSRSATEGQSNSIFAEGTYDLGNILEGLDFTLGYRYTRDQRNAFDEQYSGDGDLLASHSVEGDWKEGSYRWGLSYRQSRDVMYYFTNSKGYSTGGFNMTAPPELQVYEPESVDNFEVGVKSQWIPGPVEGRVNISAYYGDWENMQTQVTSRCETETGTVLCQLTRNAATGEIKGFEAEVGLDFTENFSISSAFGYMDGYYTDFSGLSPTGECCIDMSDTPFLYIPEWKYNIDARYTLPTPEEYGPIQLAAAYSWTDDIRTIFQISGEDGFYNTQPPMDNLNLTASWSEIMGRDGLSAQFQVSNALEDKVMHGQWGAYESVGQYGRAVALPRMWTLTLKYDY